MWTVYEMATVGRGGKNAGHIVEPGALAVPYAILRLVWLRSLTKYLKKILLSFVLRARHVHGDPCCSVSVRFKFRGGLWRQYVAYCQYPRGSRTASYHPLCRLTDGFFFLNIDPHWSRVLL